MKRVKTFYNILSIAVLYAIYIVFLLVYIIAYFTPEGKVIFDINYFHEKHVEILLFIITLPGIVSHFKKLGASARVPD